MEEEVSTGWVEPALRAEFRGLGLRYRIIPAGTGRSPRELRARLRHLSDRIHGQKVVNLRREPVASAYRVFFRQIGIDPDEHKPPGEAAMLERLRAGRFRSRDLLEDALLVAVVETGIAVRAFDADRLEGKLGLRIAREGEHLAGDRVDLPEGAIVIADERRSAGLVFGDTGTAAEVAHATRRIVLCVVRVPGIPEISVEEALWTAGGILTSEGRGKKKAESRD
jgi:DNA/RNA-binding domain of Phe-tRNA-synthetase-like protein